MTDDLTVAPADLTPAVHTPSGKFFVVSRHKLMVMYLATVGTYSVYWFYKQWDNYKDSFDYDSENGKIWPIARALFPFIFVFSLLRRLKEESSEHPQLAQWTHTPLAAQMSALLLISNILDRAAYRSIGSPVTDILSLLMLFPLLICFLSVQKKVNIACGDKDGAGNAQFSTANYCWIAVGSILWLLILIGLFLPD